jgi:hypothetical protein
MCMRGTYSHNQSNTCFFTYAHMHVYTHTHTHVHACIPPLPPSLMCVFCLSLHNGWHYCTKRIVFIVTRYSGYWVGFELDIEFIDHFNIQRVLTLNCIAIANFHTLQFTRVHAKFFVAHSFFTSSCLVTGIPLLHGQVLSEWQLISSCHCCN